MSLCFKISLFGTEKSVLVNNRTWAWIPPFSGGPVWALPQSRLRSTLGTKPSPARQFLALSSAGRGLTWAHQVAEEIQGVLSELRGYRALDVSRQVI